MAIAWFASRGHTVCIPLTDSQAYDLVVDMGDGLKKVQVKTSTFEKKGVFQVNLRTMGGNRTGTGKTKRFDKEAVDFLFVVAGDGRQYLIPCDRLRGTSAIALGPYYDEFSGGSPGTADA